jgi:hypothetical protein
MWVNSIQIRNGALSKAELSALGAPTTNGIPVRIPVETPVELCFGKIGNSLTLIWPLSATGYTLKSRQISNWFDRCARVVNNPSSQPLALAASSSG